MNQYTPGPWMWDSDPIKGDPLNRVRFQVVARGKTITQCYYSSADAQAEHDARLISSAPDLLAALKALTHSLDEHDLLHDDQRAAFKESLKSIARAEGKS